jgi:hypothetical protein
MAPSQRLRRRQVEDGRVDATDCFGLQRATLIFLLRSTPTCGYLVLRLRFFLPLLLRDRGGADSGAMVLGYFFLRAVLLIEFISDTADSFVSHRLSSISPVVHGPGAFALQWVHVYCL